MKNKKQLSNTAQTGINMVASFMTYGVSMLVSFFLSPYIVRNIGVDAYGFVTLANNFVGYVALITIALNTLSGRFVTVNIYKNDYAKANSYFSSVFYSNAIISLVITLIGAIIIVFLDSFLDVSPELLPDVRILFIFSFLNFIIGTIGNVFSVATFATNKLYLASIVGIITNIVRAAVLIISFSLLTPKTYYVAIAGLFTTLITVFTNIYYTKRLTPQLKISIKDFDIKKIAELIKGGIWATVNRIGQIFMNDLDLLISNMFINSVEMGVLSVSKTVPNAITGIVSSLVSVFSPNYTILYAQEKYDELIKNIKQSMKIMGVIVNVPVIVLIVCGKQFYTLWQPTQDADKLYKLSLLAIACIIISGGINCIYNIFTVVNKLQANAIVVVVTGFLSLLISFLLLKYTGLGLYAIAGTSTAISILRNLLFTAPYGAKCLNLKWHAFYPEIIKPVIYVFITSFVLLLFTKLFIANTWITLIILGIVTVLFSFVVGYFVMLNKNERNILKNIAKEKVLSKVKKI